MTETAAGKRRRLPYDPERPPREPPTDADPLTWMLAYGLHVEHQPGTDGFCSALACRPHAKLWPCDASALARSGFLDAVWSAMVGGR